MLISGAGPTGLTAAAVLAEAGVKSIILEAERTLLEELRASTFHPPTLDMLSRFGISAGLIERGLKAEKFQYRSRSEGNLATFDFGLISDLTEHPYRVQCEQYKLCTLLKVWLLKRGNTEIRFSHSVEAVSQDENSVKIECLTPQGVRTLKGRFLIGADGARSAVRRALEIGFVGFTWPENFLVVSTPFCFENYFNDLTQVNYFADPEEWFFLLKVPGLWRCMFPTKLEESELEIFDSTKIQTRLNRVFKKDKDYKIKHTTLYQVHQRVASNYRRGRSFLVGDAAHINNPLGGMGLNGGIHDAFNLAELLTSVIKGCENELLLDRYENQRRPIALDYVNRLTIQNKRDLEAKDLKGQTLFRKRLKEAKSSIEKERVYLKRVSMIQSLVEASLY